METKPYFVIEPLSTIEQLKAITEIYAVDEPISKILGITPSEWISFVLENLAACVGNGHSFVVINESGSVIGGITCGETLPHSQDMDGVGENMKIMLATVDELFGLAERNDPDGRWKSARYDIGIGCTSPKYRGLGIIGVLWRRILSTLPEGSIIVVPTSNEYSFRSTKSVGGVVVAELDYTTWIHRGKRPLESIPHPHTKARLLYVVVSHT
jgi:hypothetical protein